MAVPGARPPAGLGLLKPPHPRPGVQHEPLLLCSDVRCELHSWARWPVPRRAQHPTAQGNREGPPPLHTPPPRTVPGPPLGAGSGRATSHSWPNASGEAGRGTPRPAVTRSPLPAGGRRGHSKSRGHFLRPRGTAAHARPARALPSAARSVRRSHVPRRPHALSHPPQPTTNAHGSPHPRRVLGATPLRAWVPGWPGQDASLERVGADLPR